MMHDYRFRFPVSGWDDAMAALAAVGGRVGNMLGDMLDATGQVTDDPDSAVARGRAQAGWMYIHIRTEVAPESLPIDPADYGMQPISTDGAASVLGVWA